LEIHEDIELGSSDDAMDDSGNGDELVDIEITNDMGL